MTREYELPPDFKKKLQEWERIKKTSTGSRKKLGEITKWKSLGGPRYSTFIQKSFFFNKLHFNLLFVLI